MIVWVVPTREQDSWLTTRPEWLEPENSDWPGNYLVQYWSPKWQAILFGRPNAYLDRILDAVRRITSIAIENGLSCPQLCIGVLLRTPGVTGCIVGARNAHQGSLAASMAEDAQPATRR